LHVDVDDSISMIEVGIKSFDRLLQTYQAEEPEFISSDDDTTLIMYTSGTTGKPKGAMITHSNLFAASVGMSHTIDCLAQDRFLSVAPLLHIGGFITIILNLQNGSTTVIMTDFDLLAVWST